MKSMLLAVIAVLGLNAAVWADELHVNARLLCAETGAIVQIARAWNAEPEFGSLPPAFAETFAGASVEEDLECEVKLESRPTTLRIKIGTYGARHYGMCGGATKHFLSMWVGQRRILSRRMFHNPCEQFDNLDLIALTRDKMLFCAQPNVGPYWMSGPEDAVAAEIACVDVSALYLAAIRGPFDEVEYPPSGEPRREGHVILIRSEDTELCAWLHRELGAGRSFYTLFDDRGEETPGRWLEWIPGPMGRIGPYQLDINNDGLTDTVAVRQYGPGSSGEELILLAEGRDGGDDDAFTEASLLDGKLLSEMAPLIPVKETAFAEGLAGDGDMRNQVHVVLRPFEWEATRFVLMTSTYASRSPQWVVYKIAPDNGYQEVCVLDRVKIHY